MNDRLVEAFRRQRGQLKQLVIEAGVPVADVEWLVLDALGERTAGEWESLVDIDKALLSCLDRACAMYAKCRGRAYSGLHAPGRRRRAQRNGQSAGGKKRRGH